jgi:hypothetical protein
MKLPSPLLVRGKPCKSQPSVTTPRPGRAQVWISFLVAASLCAIGLAFLPGRDLDRAFMTMGYVFCISAAFALAKFVRGQRDQARRHAALGPGRLGGLRPGGDAHRLGPAADGDQPRPTAPFSG